MNNAAFEISGSNERNKVVIAATLIANSKASPLEFNVI
jgi:hypothetical protein